MAVPQVLPGHVPPQIAALGLAPIGQLDATQQLSISIALPLVNQQELAGFLDQLQDPQSANYRRFLTADEFAQKFGPAASDYAAVVAFAQAQNLTVTGTHPNRTLVDVTGSAADIQQAFGVNLLLYQHPTENREFYAPDVDPSVDLSVPLLHICGLDNYTLPRPLGCVTNTNGTYIGTALRNAYVPGGAAPTGAGQTVAIYTVAEDFYLSDITNYEALGDLPYNTNLSKVWLDGYEGLPGNPDAGDNLEISTDIEMAISMAPACSVIAYEGGGANAVADLTRIATDDLAAQISCSWDGFAYGGSAFGQTLLQYAAQGQSFFQASGDSGSYIFSGSNICGVVSPNGWAVLYAWLTDVGGTTELVTTTNGSYQSETAWSGSGGGYLDDTQFVTISAIPWWQNNTNVVNQTNQASANYRNIPDVATLAGPLFIYWTNGCSTDVQGTSAAAPLWAGLCALVNEQAASNRFAPMGFLNPALYAIGQGPNYNLCFHDITVGSNGNSCSDNLFQAVPGYDLVTGWGTPNGTNLINELIKVSDGALGCGHFVSNQFSFSVDFGAAAPTTTPYLLYSTNVAATNWTTNCTLPQTNGFQTYTDTTSGSAQSEGFYLISCGTNNCWRPTGFIRTEVPAGGMALVANQLDAPKNTLNQLFNPMPDGTHLPNGTEIWIQSTNGSWTFSNYTWTTSSGWSTGGNSVTLSAGQGFWVTNPASGSITITFAGLVRQGNLTNPIPNYEWIYSSMVAQAGRIHTDLGYTPSVNDQFYLWDLAKQQYDYYLYYSNLITGKLEWDPSEPTLALGQSFVLVPAASNVWTQTFSTCELQ